MKMRKTLCIMSALAVALLSAGCAGTAPNTENKESSVVQSSSVSSEESSGAYEPKITANPSADEYNYAKGRERMYDSLALETAEAAPKNAADTAAPTSPATATAPTAPAGEPGSDSPGTVPAVSGSETSSEYILPSDTPVPPDPLVQPGVGLLTAGLWNDNDNWGFFTNLVNTKKITLPSEYGVVPNNRTAVSITDKSGAALMNANVRLLDESGEVLYKAMSDHKGMAYLFAPDGKKPAAVEIECAGKTQKQDLNFKNPDQQSEIHTENNTVEVVFDGEGTKRPKMDIMFVVDTTGSMGDELMFLQTEFTAIAEEVGTDNTRFSINFYRDDGDAYTTKRYPFSSDVKQIQQKLNSESASGGGDLPEAVAEILDETIHDGGWSEDSVKLMFLIFDAPPHEGKQEMISKAINTAAENGIRIIPVVSSNSDRNTELFGRCIAIATGGTYVFLTDDSGVGSSHLEPIIGSYDVEKLYDVIIRVIGSYDQSKA